MPAPTYVPDGDKLRELRRAKGLSQAALAGLLFTSQPRISQLEHGARSRRAHLERHASVLDSSFEEITLPEAA